MMKVIAEFDSGFTMLMLHGKTSLSFLVQSVEALPGVVLVTQPNINELEVFLDTNYFGVVRQHTTIGELKEYFQLRLDDLARNFKLNMEYVD